jgi:hypothetical protein
MRAAPHLHCRPGWLLQGGAVFGLVSWIAILGVLSTVPEVGLGTVLSALAMAGLFAVLLITQRACTVHAGPEGLFARSLLRVVHCRWEGVHRLEVRQLLPGLRYYLLATASGPVVFSSLWSRHRELVELVRDRAGLG